jgi:allantoinase
VGLVTHAPADRFRLRKGRMEAGADADLALVALDGEQPHDDLHDRHHANPYAARTLRARVVRTLLRGRTVFAGGRVDPEPRGRLLTPDRREGAP